MITLMYYRAGWAVCRYCYRAMSAMLLVYSLMAVSRDWPI